MPHPHPPEFHRRTVELARERAKPIAKIAEDHGISESCLRNWLRRPPSTTTDTALPLAITPREMSYHQANSWRRRDSNPRTS